MTAPTTAQTVKATQVAPAPLLTIDARDDMIDGVLGALAEMAPAERKRLLHNVTGTLGANSPGGTALLTHRARLTFWNAALDLARLDAGEAVRGSSIPASVAASPAALSRFLVCRAWSAATVLPLRSVFDLLPRELRDALDDLARALAPAEHSASTH